MKHKPKLGQNFLVDPAAAVAIADALGDVSRADVVEIGPGSGAITQILASRARRLVAVELDRVLAADLRERFPGIEVVNADILATDLSALCADSGEPDERNGKLRVVGNLPYYITSPILMHLFEHSDAISIAVVMMQREVANRVSAAPGSRDYGVLSATTQLYASVERVLELPPEAFMPPPDVHSSVLRLTMRSRFAELAIAAESFLPFLRQSFAQKRKMLAKNLRAAGFPAERVEEAMEKAGIAATARAEEVEVRRMAALWQALSRES